MFLEICQNSQENTCARVSFLIKLQAPPASNGRKYYDTAVEILASLFSVHLVAGKYPSFTYILVSVIYCYGNIVEQGHFNCALSSNNSVCKVIGETIIKQTTYEEVLLGVVKQRHSHVYTSICIAIGTYP